MRCWGSGNSGRLGYGSTSNVGDGTGPSIQAAGNVAVGGTVRQIEAAGAHTCALLSDGTVRCWGSGVNGVLGYADTNDVGDGTGLSIIAAGAVDLGGTAVKLSAGINHTCALMSTGAVRCWGWGTNGRLGYDNTTTIGDTETPAAAGDLNLGGTALDVVAGQHHTCVRLTAGNIRCWGTDAEGRLGYDRTGNTADGTGPSITALGDVNTGSTAAHLSAGGTNTCAVFTDGNARCWGNGANGLLGQFVGSHIGNGTGPSVSAAANITLGGSVVGITSGTFHSCALLDSGGIRCWGMGNGGRLGYGNTDNIGDNETPASAGDVSVF